MGGFMAETKLIARHPLAESATHGIEMPGANHLELVDGARIHSILAFRGAEQSVSGILAALPPGQVRNVGPGEWLVVTGDAVQAPEIDGAMVVDQSHGRTLFRLSGPDSMAILMRGVAVDLRGGAMPTNGSASMAFGHLSINLARLSETTFELIVGRSFAESLYHELKQAGRAFGLTFGIRTGAIDY
jgi:heterotetrameric sarcosine oxidase gamma subunit